eukprot:5687049-Amphidinium_carterae.1
MGWCYAVEYFGYLFTPTLYTLELVHRYPPLHQNDHGSATNIAVHICTKYTKSGQDPRHHACEPQFKDERSPRY